MAIVGRTCDYDAARRGSPTWIPNVLIAQMRLLLSLVNSSQAVLEDMPLRTAERVPK